MRNRLAAVPDPGGQRAVAYVRVSAVMGREELQSPDLQMRRIRDLIDRRGLREVDVVQDIDVSGRHFRRDGIQRLLEMARAGQIDVVVLYDLSRLGRNTGESLRVITELRDAGVSVASTVEQIDDTPEGQFMLGQFLGMAQLYSDQIGRRWAETARWRAEQGRWHGSNPPLGYRLVKGTGLVPDPDVAPAMVEVFARYAAGHPISQIAADFNRGGGRRRTNALIVLKRALANPVYIGKVRLNGVVHPGVHDPLVDEATWARVQDRLARDAVTPSRRLAVAYPLTGLLTCGGCGYHLIFHAGGPRAGGKVEADRVGCRRHQEFRDCPTEGVGAPPVREVEAAVLDLVAQRIAGLRSSPADRATRAAGRARAAGDVRRLTRELEETRAARGRLAVDKARRIVDERAFFAADAELAAAESQLVATLGEATATATAGPARAQIAAGRWLLDRWGQLTPAEANRGLRILMSGVSLHRAERYRQPVLERLGQPLWR